ncbi:3-phenylpropionate/trans-cinnamate dioxygenase ferredoxin reductase subunit [Micromonospora rhizosphaerae]|uniref:3-phenylpropionate/trans-cinnamate dioxygenase ferredoxin reductase subunit n=1 Tax=Micromonospora rhizosphaerae TaxID=568872 RepID=A0A1C6SGW2_9ACTN|nr:FAD-dependent oxidoreductase [Micromonospora rhizosphaerae]SCL28716.1 3-phenylpropionate/trans-cinnamate dioxygenase ferredoxin reductase subunit [Micromonospora rhizosphaerae]
MNGGVLIVGASQAGVQLAASLRDHGHDGAITLVGAESHPPYERPPLSKAFLAGTADIAALHLRSESFYAEQRITVLSAERVTRLHLSPSGPPGSGSALTDRGRTLAFDRLALTVGARPRRLHVPGVDLEGVCCLRGIDDAAHIRTHLTPARNVVVIGGGFIGLEVAAVARSEGRNVTVVEAAERLIARSVAPEISEFYRRAHIRRGTEIRLGAGVAAIRGEHGRVCGVHLVDGTLLPADLVVVGVGVVPRTELAEQLGIVCDGGIVVDEYARTSEPSVVAAGDCTAAPNPLTGEGRMRLESVPNAVAQARAAAATLVGRRQPYADVPWFWSDQYDLKLQIAGVPIGYDQIVVRGDPDGESFSVLYYRRGSLLAINAVNSTRDYLAVRKALASGTSIPAEAAAVSDVPLKELLLKSYLPAAASRASRRG